MDYQRCHAPGSFNQGPNNPIHNLPADPILGIIQHDQLALYRVLASVDQLAEQQNCYNEMMSQSNAQLLATLQQLVLTMQPYLKILSLQEYKIIPSQLTTTMSNTGTTPTLPALTSRQNVDDGTGTHGMTVQPAHNIAMHQVQQYMTRHLKLSHWPLCKPAPYAPCPLINNNPPYQTFIPAKPPFTCQTKKLVWHRTKDYLRPPYLHWFTLYLDQTAPVWVFLACFSLGVVTL